MRITESQLRRIVRQEILREQGQEPKMTTDAQQFISAFDTWFEQRATAKGKKIDDPKDLGAVLDHIIKKFQEAGADIKSGEVTSGSKAAVRAMTP